MFIFIFVHLNLKDKMSMKYAKQFHSFVRLFSRSLSYLSMLRVKTIVNI